MKIDDMINNLKAIKRNHGNLNTNVKEIEIIKVKLNGWSGNSIKIVDFKNGE